MTHRQRLTKQSRRFIYHISYLQSKFEEFRKADKKEKEKTTTQGKAQRYIDACNIIMAPLLEQVMPPMPAKLWEDLTYVIAFVHFSV